MHTFCTSTGNKTCREPPSMQTAVQHNENHQLCEKSTFPLNSDLHDNDSKVKTNQKKKVLPHLNLLAPQILMMLWGQWDESGFCGKMVDSILVWLGLRYVTEYNVGAFGVSEVLGLRGLLCEAAVLNPTAAQLQWCGASVHLRAESNVTTLVKTSGSENTWAQSDRHYEQKTAGDVRWWQRWCDSFRRRLWRHWSLQSRVA